jgi:hypothetical protein
LWFSAGHANQRKLTPEVGHALEVPAERFGEIGAGGGIYAVRVLATLQRWHCTNAALTVAAH